MSRVGKLPIQLPQGVDVKEQDGSVVVKGPKGELTQQIDDSVTINIEEGTLTLVRASEQKKHVAKHGLYRALIQNMVTGVTEGFKKELELVGVGYRASTQGQKLELSLGFSHNVVMNLAPEIKVSAVSERGKNPLVTLESHDKQLLGQVAAKIRSLRPPEPYKGKGVKFVGEQLRRKAGKAAAK